MPEFAYKATDSMGKIVEGLMEAPEKQGVISKLQSLGYIPIKIDHPGRARSFSLNIDLFAFFKRVSSRDIMTSTSRRKSDGWRTSDSQDTCIQKL